MKLLLCSAVLATALLGVCGFPAEITEPDAPKKGNSPALKPQYSGIENKPRPSLYSKPSDTLLAAQSPNNFIFEVAESTVASELPTAEVSAVAADPSSSIPMEPAHDPILETASNFPAPEQVIQDVIPEADASVVNHYNMDNSAASEAVSATALGVPVDSSAQAIVADVDAHLDNSNVQLPAPSIVSKSRRHAGVEHPTALRIGDFEDVEMDSGLVAPEYPANHEQMGVNQLSKEEMILMAMDQMHHNLPHMQLNMQRPKGSRPSLIYPGSLNGKPHSFQDNFADDDEAEDNSEDDSMVDLRNGESSATIVQEQPVVSKINHISKGNDFSGSDSNHHNPSPYGSSGSRNKPRPYGMDRPSKHRPTLDSGMKDKNEHFGLPHSSSSGDYVQKGEAGLSSDNEPISYLGFQIPSIKWVSFTDLFPSFWGSRNRQNSLGKSDQAAEQSEICVDDDSLTDGLRSPTIQSNSLCHSSAIANNCHEACISKGFASGSCLGPYPTPGCMCRMPKSDEFGVVLKPLEEMVSPLNKGQDLATSESPNCKKCACMESCKNAGSYTGFCIDRCYCGVPWYMKQDH